MSDTPVSLSMPPEGYGDWLVDLKGRIHNAQQRATLAVNRELVPLYWQIGQDILSRQAQQGWGAKVIDRLAQDLRAAFPDMKGFSPRNLKYMRAFAEAWPDAKFVQEVLAQLPWYHQLALLDKLPSPETRCWYAAQAIEHNWSRNILVMQIETRLLERSGKAVSNFDSHLPKPQSDLARESLKDPYRFDFLGLTIDAQEREIENALVKHVTDFLLELGAGFAFVGQQVLLDVGGDEFFIDLLFLSPQATLLCGNRTQVWQVQARAFGAAEFLPHRSRCPAQTSSGRPDHRPSAVQEQEQEQGRGRIRPA